MFCFLRAGATLFFQPPVRSRFVSVSHQDPRQRQHEQGAVQANG